MENIYFITDLDRTIIHAKNKGFRCVEYMEEKEITYMTDESYYSMLELLKYENFKFIPCTMRNIKQTLRVGFINDYNPEYIVCTNGAQIYENGILDEVWNTKMRDLIDENEVISDIEFIKTLNISYDDIRNIEGFYITIKCNDKEEAKIAYDVLKDKFKGSIKVIHIGIKIFIIDEKINKLNAVDYLIEKIGINKLFTSGDSIVDEDFTKRGTAILPKHCSFNYKKAYISEKEGIHSTDFLLNYLKKEIVDYNLINK